MENASSISKPPISFAAQPVVAPKALFIPLPAPVVLRTTEISRDLPTPPRAFPDQTG